MKTILGVMAFSLAIASPIYAQDAATAKPKMTRPEIMLMKPTTAKTGENQFEVMVKGTDGKPISDADVAVLFVMPAMPSMKMPEMRNEVKLKPSADGMYIGMGTVMMAGKWNVTLSVKQGGKEIGQKKLTLTVK